MAVRTIVAAGLGGTRHLHEREVRMRRRRWCRDCIGGYGCRREGGLGWGEPAARQRARARWATGSQEPVGMQHFRR